MYFVFRILCTDEHCHKQYWCTNGKWVDDRSQAAGFYAFGLGRYIVGDVLVPDGTAYGMEFVDEPVKGMDGGL
jgi:hypothetical protein